jgi:hypothetical protein
MSLAASLTLAAIACCAVSACAPAVAVPADRPSSRAERVAAARDDRRLGVLERQGSNPGGETCEPTADGFSGPICWTSAQSPARAFDVQADGRYLAAAERRRTSQALRDVEATACVGVPIADRVESPFAHREDILDVEELSLPGVGGSVSLGAKVQFRAVPGLTTEWLQRVVDCHLARDAVLGHDVAEMAYCPLVPLGARATVRAGSNGYFIDVVSDDDRAGREIARRARALWP